MEAREQGRFWYHTQGIGTINSNEKGMDKMSDNKFDWKRLGDVPTGRENLGEEMPVAVYRLMQYTLMDVLTDKYGEPQAEDIFRQAGYVAGTALADNVLDTSLEFGDFIRNLQDTLRDLKIGLIKIESADMEAMKFSLTVDEDLDCSGLPVYGKTVCFYDEGFIAGILKAYTKKEFVVKEIDCWATGGRTCRFTAEMVS